MVTKRISITLSSIDGHVCCSSCQHPLCRVDENWKEQAVLKETPVTELPGGGLGTEPNVLVRHFICVQCGALLDTETALPGDPFLIDRVFV